MDDQVLSKRVKTLNKAAAAAEPPSVVIGLLEELKNAASPTEEQLRVSLSKPDRLAFLRGILTVATCSQQKRALQ
jgi:hypothetical protein